MIGGVALIVLFLTSTIHLPIWGSSFIGIGYRAVIGLFVDLIAAVMVFAPALGIYIFRDKSGTEMKLLDIISAFSLLLMPVAFANILSFLFGFFAQSIAMLIMTIATMFISVLSLVAIYENCVGDKDLKIWKTVVVYAIVLIMISLVLGLMIAAVQAMLESAVNGIVDDIIPYNGFLG